MGAIAAHRAPERVADGTRTQVWAWMTNKCRKRMNEKKRIYNNRDLPKGGRGGGRRKRREASRKEEKLETLLFGRGVLFPWDVGPTDSVFLAPI